VDQGRCGAPLIFVVGMPRCGSTLVEQILATHPDVRAGGERSHLKRFIDAQSAKLDEPYPSWTRRLDREVCLRPGSEFVSQMDEVLGERPRFVEKQLANYLHLGFIAAILPAAKVIHCRRDAMDTCVSCYFTNLQNIAYTHDLTTLGNVYRDYERLMAPWHCVLPGRILEVSYESVVSEPETQIRRLLAHCELSRDPECLAPHKTKRAVLTASAAQVKRPISSQSVGRWRNYEKHLGPLIEAPRS
jgi:sulfotransferase family protein